MHKDSGRLLAIMNKLHNNCVILIQCDIIPWYRIKKGEHKLSKDIGRKLKHLRHTRKLSQEQISDIVKIPRSTISNYETGRRTPHLNDLQKFAKTYGVGLDYFNKSAKDEAFNLLARAKEVFESPDVSKDTKEALYMEFMKLYLTVKAGENA